MPSKKRYFKRVCWYLFFIGLTSPHVIYLKKEMYNSLQLNWSLLKRVSSSIKIFPMNTSERFFVPEFISVTITLASVSDV